LSRFASPSLDGRCQVNQSDENPLEIQIDEALAEYMSECDSGVIPNRDEFLAKQPADLREQLQDLLSAADWIEQLAGPTLQDLSSPGSVAAVTSEDTLPHNSVKVQGDPKPVAYEKTLPQSFGSLGFSMDETQAPQAAPSKMRELSLPVLPCQFGDYVLERVLGRGGMGVVYFGHQRNLDRPVAIKMIRSGALASAEEVRRFYAEARSAAKLDHPNIVTVYQCGEFEGHHFFSMDYVAGTDLARMTETEPLDGKRAARYVRDVARAIQFAHDRGILHRDLKPANVLVDETDTVRVTDFGLAKLIGHETGLTATGAALGTPSYMSPEQASGRVDEQLQATDIYSIGAVLFTIVTGRPPFRGNSVVQTIMQVIHRPAPMARAINKKVDEDLETIIDVCLQKSPQDRYPTAAALAAELDRYLNGVPIQARPTSHFRRTWYWLLGVPIFGAILDNRVIEPTDAHRWVQRGLISAGLLLILAWMLLLIPTSVWYKNRMPHKVRFAAGVSGGNYDRIARQLSEALSAATDCKTDVISTAGSNDNLELLLNGKVDLALLQADSVGSSTIAVIAPLYYEAVHIIVQAGSELTSIQDLKGKRVTVGSEKAGARGVTKLLLEHAGLSLADITIVDAAWQNLQSDKELDAAIVVSRIGSPELVELLGTGAFQLMGMSDAIEFALDEPIFHPLNVSPAVYPNCGIGEFGTPTVATTAYLATRFETADILVQNILERLYAPEMVGKTGILPLERAAHWQGLAWHQAALDFFSRSAAVE
jgi:eukaryotic-like serine/threonine-protein kinase